ncbi:hypothetical protein ATCC90586_006825 [Pythium insidiosum]|nr:hypothetical protein ATCC90586_006825 [Pythium insidiosum]
MEMNAAAPSLVPPPAVTRVSPGDIRSLILEKEKELHDINEYRIRTLETLLREKESAAQAYKQKFVKLQEDFKYNLKLLEGRDEELALYDTNFASLKSVVRDREAEVSELKAQIADLQSDLKQEQKRIAEQDAYYQQKLKDARAQMEGARWNFDEELRRAREEVEQIKRKTDRQLREQQDDLETQRREITLTFDDVMRQREGEYKARMEELQTHTRELELKLKATQRESDMHKERNEELKMKMENLQHVLNDSEKEAKALEWQLSDLRSAKDARIAELEDEILKLQDVKQSLLDEYEGKMAELLQSLHSVEKAFVQQKAHYEDELQRQLKRRDDESQSVTARLDAKLQGVQTKLRERDELVESLQGEIKQLQWERDDKALEHSRELERLQQEAQDLQEQKQQVVAELKQQLWTAEREQLHLQEKLKDATTQLAMQKEKEKVQRQDLADTIEKQDDLKREIVTLNLRWENKLQAQEQELSGRHELRLRELQQARDRVLSEKQAVEEQLVHAETELRRARAELLTLQSNARVLESFGGITAVPNASGEKQEPAASIPVPSPLWSDDNGTLSPLADVSPLLTESPQLRSSTDALQTENAKLRAELIRQMKEALAQQAEAASASSPAPHAAESDLSRQLAAAEKQCVLLEAKLRDAESKHSESLQATMAQLASASRALDEKNARIQELEERVETLTSQQRGDPSPGAAQVVADAQVGDLKRRLASAQQDIERLVKERTQLMELSNQLTAELRRLREAATTETPAFTGKKDYENLIAELSRSLEEAKLHNRTLKKELRRMVKLQVASAKQSDDVEAEPTTTTTTRRRSSTLSMMKALDNSASRSASVVSASGSSVFDDELLSLVRGKLPVPASKRTSTAVPPSIPEHGDGDEKEDESASRSSSIETARAVAPLPVAAPAGAAASSSSSSLSMLFSRDRMEQQEPAPSSGVSDARLRLQQAKEALLLAGKKAERSVSLATSSASVPARLSDRETPSQRSAIKKLKDLQLKRAEMVNERKKVRNYSLAT